MQRRIYRRPGIFSPQESTRSAKKTLRLPLSREASRFAGNRADGSFCDPCDLLWPHSKKSAVTAENVHPAGDFV
jgi:hypothetical protein